jgi:hypothetical protein
MLNTETYGMELRRELHMKYKYRIVKYCLCKLFVISLIKLGTRSNAAQGIIFIEEKEETHAGIVMQSPISIKSIRSSAMQCDVHPLLNPPPC